MTENFTLCVRNSSCSEYTTRGVKLANSVLASRGINAVAGKKKYLKKKWENKIYKLERGKKSPFPGGVKGISLNFPTLACGNNFFFFSNFDCRV